MFYRGALGSKSRYHGGNVVRVREKMIRLMQHLRYALRQLRKSPGFTTVAVLTLALGIGATTAIYTVLYATFLAPMPYPHPEQLVMVWSKIRGERNSVSAGDFLDWKRQSTVFQ